jgi:hypothetical protein
VPRTAGIYLEVIDGVRLTGRRLERNIYGLANACCKHFSAVAGVRALGARLISALFRKTASQLLRLTTAVAEANTST